MFVEEFWKLTSLQFGQFINRAYRTSAESKIVGCLFRKAVLHHFPVTFFVFWKFTTVQFETVFERA
jgi:uncharacterized membrane protein YwzB